MKPLMLFVLPFGIGGIGGVIEVMRNLTGQANASDSVSGALLIPSYDQRQPTLRLENGVDTHRIRVMAPWTPGGSLREFAAFLVGWPICVWRLRKLLQQIDPAGVNAHYPDLWCYTLLVALRWAQPEARFVVSFHGLDLESFRQASRFARWFWKAFLRRADAVTCCSSALKAELAAVLGEELEHSACVHNGIDAPRLEKVLKHGNVPPNLAGRRYVFNAATFEHKKGQDLLVRAFAGIQDAHPDLSLVLAGRVGPALADLYELVHELALDDRVVILENVTHADVMAIMANAEVFALSSRREPFGIVLLEAAFSGIPMVAAEVGGIPEILEHEKSALLVPPEDARALGNAILRLLGDRDLAGELRQYARTQTLPRFSWDSAFERYRALTVNGTRR